MIQSHSDPVISIVIPLYNGEEFLEETLSNIVNQFCDNKIEIVMCDDVSSDKTVEIASGFSNKYQNIKFFQNDSNLGMDKNFEQVADLATGEFIWFCGQDDILGNGAIQKVLSIIENYPQVDFIYANYSQNSHDLSKTITEKMLNIEDDVLCEGYKAFLALTELKILPTFLPSFIIRKALWDTIDKKPFYGTQYIQVGVLLSLLERFNALYIIAKPYIKGRIPDTGWHKNLLTLLDITSGYLEVLNYINNQYPNVLPEKFFKEVFLKKKREVFLIAILARRSDHKLNDKLIKRFSILFNKKDNYVIRFIFLCPSFVVALFYFLMIKPFIVLAKVVNSKVRQI